MRINTFIFVFLLFAACESATSCLDPFDNNKEVDSWFLYTPENYFRIDKGTFSFVFATKAVGQQDYVWKTITKTTQVEAIQEFNKIFASHVNAAKTRNNPFLTELNTFSIKPNEPKPSTINVQNHPQVLQMWFQNRWPANPTVIEQLQSHTWVNKPKYTVNTPTNSEQTTYPFIQAHTKMMVTYDFGIINNVQEHKGYIIKHSFPEVPAAVYDDNDEFRFTDTTEKRLVYSQHAFCFNIDANDLRSLLDIFPHLFLPLVNYNIHVTYLPEQEPVIALKKYFINLIVPPGKYDKVEYPVNEATVTLVEDFLVTFYNQKTPASRANTKLHKKIRSNMDVIGHSILPSNLYEKVINANNQNPSGLSQNEKQMQDIAPFPWSAVAEIMQTDLQLMHWGKLGCLPRFEHGFDIDCVSEINLKWGNVEKKYIGSYLGPYNAHRGFHQKIGIGVKKNIVCIGDANHSYAEFHRGGFTVCFESKTISDQFRNVKTGTARSPTMFIPTKPFEDLQQKVYKEDQPEPYEEVDYSQDTLEILDLLEAQALRKNDALDRVNEEKPSDYAQETQTSEAQESSLGFVRPVPRKQPRNRNNPAVNPRPTISELNMPTESVYYDEIVSQYQVRSPEGYVPLPQILDMADLGEINVDDDFMKKMTNDIQASFDYYLK